MKERIHFSGTNTALSKLLSLRCEASLSPKGLKQMMNRWAYPLQDHGVTFRDHRSNGQRLVEINYTPPMIEVTEGTQNIGGIENASLASFATL